MDIPFPVPVRCSPALLEPGIVGFFRPTLLLPEGIVDRLAPNQLRAVLAHELCHLRRRDNLTAALHMVVEAAFWFHPFVWLISSRLIAERERACDEAVLETGADPQAYAETILKTCQFYVESPLACVPGVTGADLKKRMVRIMTGNAGRHLGFRGKLLIGAAALVGIAVPVVFGLLNTTRLRASSQSPSTGASSTVFESASIKRHRQTGDKTMFFSSTDRPPEGKTMFFSSLDHPPAGLIESISGGPLAELIRIAFGVQSSQILGGPVWLRSEPYDIEIKCRKSVADELDKLSPAERIAEEQRMLQGLLADRLHLAAHRESRQLPIYALVVAKGGPRLQEARPGETDSDGVRRNGPEMEFGPGQLTAHWVSVADLVNHLTNQREIGGHMVIDQTGLTGNYDFILRWSPEKPASSQSSDNAASSTSASPALFTALEEQLGLALESTTRPIEVLVIDHVERPTPDE
jgi:uncharacterized protein (TIGR03435 family)